MAAGRRSVTAVTTGRNRLSHRFGPLPQRVLSERYSVTEEVICGARGTPSPSSQGPCGFLDEAIERHLCGLGCEGKAEGTVKAYGAHLRAFAAFVGSLPGPPGSLADLTCEVVLAFRDHEIARERRGHGSGPPSARTIQGAVKALRGFFRSLVRRGALLLDPALDLRAPRLPVRLPRNIPTARQMKRLLSAPDTRTALGKRDRAILELLYGTGLRSAELCGLLRGDVDLDRRTVFVRKGKGGKDRLIPLGRSAARAVSEYLGVWDAFAAGRPPDPILPLLLTCTGQPLGNHVLKKQLRRHLRKAGLSLSATPHSLRHACATHLLQGGADIRQIQALLGHASIEATQVYTKVETSDLLRMLDRHHPRSWDEGER